jgi:hypothetical protein
MPGERDKFRRPATHESPPLEEMITDLDAYRELLEWPDRLNWLAPRCWSNKVGRAMAMAALVTRGLATLVYRTSLADADDGAGSAGAP